MAHNAFNWRTLLLSATIRQSRSNLKLLQVKFKCSSSTVSVYFSLVKLDKLVSAARTLIDRKHMRSTLCSQKHNTTALSFSFAHMKTEGMARVTLGRDN